ncbi:MAG TPA: imelysin family protein [Polyangiales bacterium]
MSSSRRVWLKQSAALGLCVMAGACKRPPTRKDVLEALVREQVVPDIKALAPACRALAQALQQLESAPSAAGLVAARAAFSEALVRFQRAQTFRSGPLVESNTFLRAAFWPVRGANLERVIADSVPLTAASVEALGVDAKGLFALERLLFDQVGGGAEDWLCGPDAMRARRFARLLAEDVASRVDAVVASMGDGGGFARRFAADGQAGLTRLITQNVETLESIALDRLQRPLELHAQGRLKPGEVPGDFSGLSFVMSRVQLEALRAQYVGRDDRGVAALVVQAAPAIAPRVQGLLDGALGALEALQKPLRQTLEHSPAAVKGAFDQVKALEIAYKVELASALAVTLSLVSGDGD